MTRFFRYSDLAIFPLKEDVQAYMDFKEKIRKQYGENVANNISCFTCKHFALIRRPLQLSLTYCMRHKKYIGWSGNIVLCTDYTPDLENIVFRKHGFERKKKPKTLEKKELKNIGRNK